MSRIVLLDGGMGQELIARSSQPPSPLWSAKVMMDEPEIVEAVHRDYIDAGARVITLNAYSATPERLARDASEDLFEPLQAKAIDIAKRAIDGRRRKEFPGVFLRRPAPTVLLPEVCLPASLPAHHC